MSSDWTAGTLPSNTYGLSVPQQAACEVEIAGVNAGGVTCCSHMHMSADRTKQMRRKLRETVKNCLLISIFRCLGRRGVQHPEEERRVGVTDMPTKGHSSYMSHQVKGQGRNCLNWSWQL